MLIVTNQKTGEPRVNKNLAGRCGLYCGFCSIHRAGKDSRKLQEELAKKYNCRPEEVRCEGCQTIDVSGWSHEARWGKNCAILKCLNDRKMEFCCECAEYEMCQKFEEIATLSSELETDLRENLRMIKEGKVEEWLLKEDQKWRCPRCGNPIINSNEHKTCHWCGQKLRN